MPRRARSCTPGSIQHIIARFSNNDWLMVSARDRDAYLKRVPSALNYTDWAPLGFALMNTHVHWVFLAGARPAAAFIQPLHIGFASWVNQVRQREGPVFGDRFRSVEFGSEMLASLLAYVHNNPIRAGLTSDPAGSDWTSHRAFIDPQATPSWLDVPLALELAGFDASAEGRRRFHEFVQARACEGRKPAWSGASGRRIGAHASFISPARRASVLRMAHAQVVAHGAPEWRGTADEFVRRVAEHGGVTCVALCSQSRVRALVRLRRLAVLVWRQHLGRPLSEIAEALELSISAASALIRRRPDRVDAVRLEAAYLAEQLVREGNYAGLHAETL